jgi:hypothetical protein
LTGLSLAASLFWAVSSAFARLITFSTTSSVRVSRISPRCATEPQDGFLRQGCFLTLDPDWPGQWHLVERTGQRTPVGLDAGDARDYAFTVAERFGVGTDRVVLFQKRAKADLPESGAKRRAKSDSKVG